MMCALHKEVHDESIVKQSGPGSKHSRECLPCIEQTCLKCGYFTKPNLLVDGIMQVVILQAIDNI